MLPTFLFQSRTHPQLRFAVSLELTFFIRRHEGVEIMTWKPDFSPPTSHAPQPQGVLDKSNLWHNGLDVYLQSIFRQTHINYINGQMLTENFFSSRRYERHTVLVQLNLVIPKRSKIITWDVGDKKRTANYYLRQCLNYFNTMIKSQENSGFLEVRAPEPYPSFCSSH
jgi:hypothetical protein